MFNTKVTIDLLSSFFFQVWSSPLQQTCVLSHRLVRSSSLHQSALGRVSQLELVCFSGVVKDSAGGTIPLGAAWFPPSGDNTVCLSSSSSVSWTLMEYLHVIPAQVGEARRRAPSSAPPSTQEPSCVSFPAANLPFHKSCVALTLTSLPVLIFCIFHHAHILEKHACHFMLSRIGLAFGVVAAMGAFAAGNCNVSTALMQPGQIEE